MRVYKEFFFEAAHWLPSAPPGHRNVRVHGHSFRARVSVDGEPDPVTGVLLHFDDIEAAVAEAVRVGEATRDVGGRLGTRDAGQALSDRLKDAQAG